MNSNKFLKIIAVSSLMLMTATSTMYAQRGRGNGMGQGAGQGADAPRMLNNIPGLSDEQQASIQKLFVEHQKEMLATKNILAEKRAHLNTLSTTDNADMNAINKTIEEIGDIQVELMKERANHRQKVRNLLNDEQKIYFDTHFQNRSRKGRNGMGKSGVGPHSGSGYRAANCPNPNCPRIQ